MVRNVEWRVPALAVFLAVVAAPSATAADYVRLADALPDDDLAIAGNKVLVGTSPQRTRSTLTAYGLDGSVQDIPLAGRPDFVEEIDTSAEGLATILNQSVGPVAFYYGPPLGPLVRMRRATDVAVTGDTVVALRERRRHGWLELRDLGDGTKRRIDIPGHGLAVLSAAGRYAAYTAHFTSPRQVTVVIDLETGREAYRVRTPGGETDLAFSRLGPNGRLWFQIWDRRRSARLMTVAPWRRRPRTLARLPLHPYQFTAVRGRLAVIQTVDSDHSRVVLIRPSGERRAITPPVPLVGSLAYDGTTLAFAAGDCVFAGPIPTGPPAPLDTAGCDPPE
jgi:hypothetical protein